MKIEFHPVPAAVSERTRAIEFAGKKLPTSLYSRAREAREIGGSFLALSKISYIFTRVSRVVFGWPSLFSARPLSRGRRRVLQMSWKKVLIRVLTVVRPRFTRVSPLRPVRAQVVRTHNADAHDGGVGRAGGKGGGIIRDLKGRLAKERK